MNIPGNSESAEESHSNIDNKNIKTEELSTDEQNLAHFYRKRFLTLLTNFAGTPCTIYARNNIVYKCVYAQADSKFETVCLDNINTGIGNITHALMRTDDIEYMHCIKTDPEYS